jgi:hypothetical protein
MLNSFIKTALACAVILLLSSTIVYAGGLSTKFVEVTLDKLELGKIYSVKETTGKTLVITNTTQDQTVDIEIEPEAPVDYNLVEGYEPIPDLSSVMVEKSYFTDVGPGKEAETDILMSIPNDEALYGKKYQVYIYSHTAGTAATFRMGLMSRIFLHISEKPSVSEKPGISEKASEVEKPGAPKEEKR